MFRIVISLLCMLPLALAGCSSTPKHPELADDDQAIVAEIERLVGRLSVGTDGEPDLTIDQAGHVNVIDLSGKEKVNDAVLEHLGKLTHAQKIFLSNTPVTDAGLVHLAALSELTHINLDGTAITNAGLMHLKPLENLRTVFCLSTQVNTAGSNELKKALPKVLVTHGGGSAVP